MELRENELQQELEMVKTWSQIAKESISQQKELIEKQIKIQIIEEKETHKMSNIIMKGVRDYGDREDTNYLDRDFLLDKLQWKG